MGWGDGLASRSVLHASARTSVWSPASTVKAKCGDPSTGAAGTGESLRLAAQPATISH